MGDAKFAVVNYFNQQEANTVSIDNIMVKSKVIMEEKIASGEWGERKVQWFRINKETHPDMVPEEGLPTSLMITTLNGM